MPTNNIILLLYLSCSLFLSLPLLFSSGRLCFANLRSLFSLYFPFATDQPLQIDSSCTEFGCSLSLSLTLSFSFTLFFTRSFFCPISFSLALSYSLFLVLSFSVALFCIERQLLHLIQDIPLAWNALVPAFHCYLWYGSHTATMNPRCIRKAFEFRSMFSNHLLLQIIQICSCNWKIEYLHRLILARHQPFSHFKWRCIHFISFCFEKNRENTTNFCSASRYEQQQQQKREEKREKVKLVDAKFEVTH